MRGRPLRQQGEKRRASCLQELAIEGSSPRAPLGGATCAWAWIGVMLQGLWTRGTIEYSVTASF